MGLLLVSRFMVNGFDIAKRAIAARTARSGLAGADPGFLYTLTLLRGDEGLRLRCP